MSIALACSFLINKQEHFFKRYCETRERQTTDNHILSPTPPHSLSHATFNYPLPSIFYLLPLRISSDGRFFGADFIVVSFCKQLRDTIADKVTEALVPSSTRETNTVQARSWSGTTAQQRLSMATHSIDEATKANLNTRGRPGGQAEKATAARRGRAAKGGREGEWRRQLTAHGTLTSWTKNDNEVSMCVRLTGTKTKNQ